ncbi:protein translocase subunit SecD [Parachlamydia sp. AcF125]|uniref:protein translocase subunit SecD n=1 Tax=Parachlamydia sp. AcF125 TaxID=2795736 RepID=UPI001BCA3BD1|nr:protein translocase subunit SecD [Parachlamydia sp. AcF125]MBS4167976.1 Protein translocase subunit SecDF [Parachlamydia sp. AcF125]
MEKQKRWQLYLIIAVIVLTLYNILPTVFYYSKPLSSPIDAPRAHDVAVSIVDRVNALEDQSREWLKSFSKLLGIKPEYIELNAEDPRLFRVGFKSPQDAELFKRFLPQAGSLIGFVPAQLSLYPGASLNGAQEVLVARQIGVHLDPSEVDQLFKFIPKYQPDGTLSNTYRDLVYDRAALIAHSFAGPSEAGTIVKAIVKNPTSPEVEERILALAREIGDIDQSFAQESGIAKRLFASFMQVNGENPKELAQKFLAKVENLKTKVEARREALILEQKKKTDSGEFLGEAKEQELAALGNQKQTLETAAHVLRNRSAEFNASLSPLSLEEIQKTLATTPLNPKNALQTISLQGRNPFVDSLLIDWGNDRISIKFYEDVQKNREADPKNESLVYLKNKLNHFIVNNIALASRLADETISPDAETFSINLNQLTNAQSFLTFDLGSLANKQIHQVIHQLNQTWVPQHPDLVRENYPINLFDAFKKLPAQDQKLGLVVYAPAMYAEAPPQGFNMGSLYVIAKGLDTIIQTYRDNPKSTDSELLIHNINQLNDLLRKNGFIGYPGSSYDMGAEFSKDFIFELQGYYQPLLTATREDFRVKGSKKMAVLDFTDVEQRILTQNKIGDRIQEDLLKWVEDYNAAQVDLDVTRKYLIPAPTRNPYWENFKLSVVKYFRGDDRKNLKWGLDLSGGKTVRIGLRDHNNRPVTNPEDLKQATNELYTRINKMGVSERTIRVENSHIILDFPGSQALSASELVQASAMYFHIVNEKFSPNNPALKDTVNQFLQGVWNEAVVTNRKDAQGVNEIAWRHLGGDGQHTFPRGEAARVLYENGLRLPSPEDTTASNAFNDTLSAIAIMRGDDYSEWEGQSTPLLIVFRNYALEGSSLTNVQVGYDPTQGNILSFGVKGSYDGNKMAGNPRDNFYAWTSQFAEDKILGTPKENYSHGRGWRMAVILNQKVISQPGLRAALRDGATISGRFSQREINQLAADLKAGSLSFTPYVLSEQNVSAELGTQERVRGIGASLVALTLVVIAMVGYYRFAGFVASCAVLLNILIMWGVLQNIGAALTLPGIAGIVLTIGMAVDANVLVFERIREEFKISGRIGSAIQAGYRKAFSAIVDSNVTTILAALVLIQFDSGPIKGFAITLIIGIISSMFTALFMTRYFFAGWVKKPHNKSLTMSEFIGKTQFDFIGQTKKAVMLSVIVMLIGGYLFIAQKNTIFGMDFTGGYSLNLEVQEKADHPSYRQEVTNSLLAAGASVTDVQVQELSKPNQLRIQLGMGMEEQGHPFYQLPEVSNEEGGLYEYQTNPRIVWLVSALEEGGISLPKDQLESLNRNWTVMSGQLSEAMRDNALIGLAIALAGILIYITLRFEFKYAIGAVIALAHDVILTLGIVALFHKLGFPVQIDLEAVGAIMTIIGYSLNDTIIVFDRIREDVKIYRKMSFREILNHSINVTLSRTMMTSGTTLLVLLALVLLGGPSIFGFSLVMTIGVIVGTLSSLFIAGPVMLYFHNRELAQQQKEQVGYRKV